jgi:hypothetical protein
MMPTPRRHPDRQDIKDEKPPGPLGGFFASVLARSAAKFANSQIQNRPLLDSKTEVNGVSGFANLHQKLCRRCFDRNRFTHLARARDSPMPRNFDFLEPVDPRDQWPLAIFVANALLIVALGISSLRTPVDAPRLADHRHRIARRLFL